MKPLALIIAAFLILGLAWSIVRADDTGAKVTGTVESAGTWADFTTTRLNTSDNSRASCSFPESSCTGQLSDYDFGIPPGATIDGISVTGEVACAGAGLCLDGVSAARLKFSLSWDNGSSFTAVKTSGALTSTDTVHTFGGASDTWGRSWSASEFADGTFLASSTATSVSAGDAVLLDAHSITVYYTPAAVVSETSHAASFTNSPVSITGGGSLYITI